jgi:hypothetical protein
MDSARRYPKQLRLTDDQEAGAKKFDEAIAAMVDKDPDVMLCRQQYSDLNDIYKQSLQDLAEAEAKVARVKVNIMMFMFILILKKMKMTVWIVSSGEINSVIFW